MLSGIDCGLRSSSFAFEVQERSTQASSKSLPSLTAFVGQASSQYPQNRHLVSSTFQTLATLSDIPMPESSSIGMTVMHFVGQALAQSSQATQSSLPFASLLSVCWPRKRLYGTHFSSSGYLSVMLFDTLYLSVIASPLMKSTKRAFFMKSAILLAPLLIFSSTLL